MNERFSSSSAPEKIKVPWSNFEFKSFSPEKAPKSPDLYSKSYRDSQLVLRSGVAPVLIQDPKLRRKAVCSAMVNQFILREYGAKNVIKLNRTKSLDAWDFKDVGLKTGELRVAESSLDTMQLRAGKMHVTNGPAYRKKMADVLSSPGIILIYHKRTRYFRQVLRSNRTRSEDHKSFNSHIGYNLGMKLQRDIIDVSAGRKLSRYLRDKTKFLIQDGNPYELQVIRDGSPIEYTADTILQNGDYVQYNEPQILHYYDTTERIDGAFEISKWGDLFNERLELNQPETEQEEQSSILPSEIDGYLQLAYLRRKRVRRFKSVGAMLKNRLGLNRKEIRSYLLALELMGLPANKITPTTIIPKLTMDQVNRVLEQFGGQDSLKKNIGKSKLKLILNDHPHLIGSVIANNSTPESHFKFIFDIVEQSVPNLKGIEKRIILQMIDQSISAIDLSRGRFYAGSITTISRQRVSAITSAISDIRERPFTNITSPVLRSRSEAIDILDYLIDKSRAQFNLTAISSQHFFNFERIQILKTIDPNFSRSAIERGNYRISFNMQELQEIISQFTRQKTKEYNNIHSHFSIYHKGEVLEIDAFEEVRDAVRLVTKDHLMRTIIMTSHILEVRRPGWQRKLGKSLARPVGLVRSAGALQTRASIGNLRQVVSFYNRFKDSKQRPIQRIIQEITSQQVFRDVIRNRDENLTELSRVDNLIRELHEDTYKPSYSPEYSDCFVSFDTAVRETLDLPLIPSKIDRVWRLLSFDQYLQEFILQMQEVSLENNPLLNMVQSEEFRKTIEGQFNYAMDKETLHHALMQCIRIFGDKSINLDEKRSRITTYSGLLEQRLELEQREEQQLDDFQSVIEESANISSLIALENMRSDVDLLANLAFIYGQNFDPHTNWVAFRMLLTCHNRGLGNVLMSVAENFTYKFYSLIGNTADNPALIQREDIDILKNSQTMGSNKIKIYRTIKSLATQLRRRGQLSSSWTDSRIEEQAQLILTGGGVKKLLESQLLIDLNNIYAEQNGEPVGIVFAEEDMRDTLFSYGGKLIRSQADLDRIKDGTGK